MIQINGFRVSSDNPDMIIRSKITGARGKLLSRTPANATADDYEELDADTIAREEQLARLDQQYQADVEARIRTRYTISQEIAILRQRDTKPDEFADYNTFAEACKAEARAAIINPEDN